MREQLLALYELQEIDVAILELEKKHDLLPTRLREQEAIITQLRLKKASLSQERDGALQEAKISEANVSAESQKVKKWEARLNEMRNHRDSLSLSREIESAKRANQEQEDKTLDIMKKAEDLLSQLNDGQEKLTKAEEVVVSERSVVQKEQAELKMQIQNQKSRREKIAPKLPKNVLSKYEMIRNKRTGIGLAMVVDGCCKVCHMNIPPQLYNILMRVNSLEQCPSCHRIIFWEGVLPPREVPLESAESTTQPNA